LVACALRLETAARRKIRHPYTHSIIRNARELKDLLSYSKVPISYESDHEHHSAVSAEQCSVHDDLGAAQPTLD
jgi:hypothetical protein